jgi:putative inorganic carbon (hco3(-)) transporter
MRVLMLLMVFLGLSGTALVVPHVGVLVWTWIAVMVPHQLTWDIAANWNLVFVVALATALSWVLSAEPKRLPLDATTALILLFMTWMTVSTVFALVPAQSWGLWDRYFKFMVLIVAILGLMHRKSRIHALIWVLVLSVGYYGVKGGGFTLATGGLYTVLGPDHSMLGDNNQLAVGLAMTIPLINYLRLNSENRLIRMGLVLAAALCLIAIIGSYSRGGLLALVAMLGFLAMKSRRKLLIFVLAAAVVVPGVMLMPERWKERMDTISHYDEDESVQGRLDAWTFAIRVAADRPLVGGGFGATEVRRVFQEYVPGQKQRAAHSIYFMALGDLGYVGLGLFLAILFVGWRNASWIIRASRNRPERAWARDLADMTQVSLIGFMIGGAALSLTYFTLPYALIASMALIRRMIRQEDAQAGKAAVPARRPTPPPTLIPAKAGLRRSAAPAP